MHVLASRQFRLSARTLDSRRSHMKVRLLRMCSSLRIGDVIVWLCTLACFDRSRNRLAALRLGRHPRLRVSRDSSAKRCARHDCDPDMRLLPDTSNSSTRAIFRFFRLARGQEGLREGEG
eukprot:2294300-Pleurochrysis_carterae.AAC.2